MRCGEPAKLWKTLSAASCGIESKCMTGKGFDASRLAAARGVPGTALRWKTCLILAGSTAVELRVNWDLVRVSASSVVVPRGTFLFQFGTVPRGTNRAFSESAESGKGSAIPIPAPEAGQSSSIRSPLPGRACTLMPTHTRRRPQIEFRPQRHAWSSPQSSRPEQPAEPPPEPPISIRSTARKTTQSNCAANSSARPE